MCAQTDPPGSSGEQVTIPTNEPAYAVVERGANHRVWQMTNYATLSSGETVPHNHKYTELVTGMQHQDAEGQWVESKEQIEILLQSATAVTNRQHKVYFPSDVCNSVIVMVMPDGKQLRSWVVGLSYSDVLLLGMRRKSGENHITI